MTPSQLSALKTAIFASQDAAVITARNALNDTEIARLYNLPSTFIAWRTSVKRTDAMSTGFDWAQVDNLTTGQGRIWDWMFDTVDRTINPGDQSIRDGITECWKGTVAKVANATFIFTKCKRTLSEGEKVFATGTGTTVTPGVIGWEGTVSAQDASDALRI